MPLDPATGTFKVKSRHSSEWYNLTFGTGEEMPRCSCSDWLSSFMLCKHFFAVMRSNSEWSWEKLPAKYLSSPYFITDSEIDFGKAVAFTGNGEENIADKVPPQKGTFDEEIVHALPIKSYVKRSKASACREVLGQLKSLSYLVDDDEAISELLDGLIELREDFKCHVQREDGIDLEKKQNRPIFKDKIVKRSSQIPLRLSKKRPFSGRVGVGARNKRRAQDIEIGKEPDCFIENNIEETQNLLEMYEFPIENADGSLSDKREQKDACAKNTELKETNKRHPSQGKNSPASMPKEVSEKGDCVDGEDTVMKCHKSIKKVHQLRQRILKFSYSERQEILGDHMLTDMTINFAQNVLKRQYPQNSGFEDTLLGIISDFSKHLGNSQYTQILHTGSLHWVCISNVSKTGCLCPENVNLYDSLNSKGTINLHTQLQIADFLYLTNAPEILLMCSQCSSKLMAQIVVFLQLHLLLTLPRMKTQQRAVMMKER